MVWLSNARVRGAFIYSRSTSLTPYNPGIRTRQRGISVCILGSSRRSTRFGPRCYDSRRLVPK